MPRKGTRAPKHPRVPRRSGELVEALRSQYRFLVRSAKAFDEGAEDEALRLAVSCRVLFRESGGKSLMQQLGASKTIKLPDTAILHERTGPIRNFQLIGTDEDGNEGTVLASGDDPPGGLTDPADGRDGGMRWTASLDTRMEGASWINLSEWLAADAVRGSSGVIHSRSDFIRVLANQEGGAHIDSTVEADYAELRSDTLGVAVGTVPSAPVTSTNEMLEGIVWELPETNVVEASMRQIGHEAIRALEKHFAADLS